MLPMKLDEKLLEDIEKDIRSYVGKTIDISDAPVELSSHLDVEWASSQGVTQHEMSVQVAEDRIRAQAAKDNVEVVSFVRQQVENEPDLIKQLRTKYVILFK